MQHIYIFDSQNSQIHFLLNPFLVNHNIPIYPPFFCVKHLSDHLDLRARVYTCGPAISKVGLGRGAKCFGFQHIAVESSGNS
jgi:hypothetical protein